MLRITSNPKIVTKIGWHFRSIVAVHLPFFPEREFNLIWNYLVLSLLYKPKIMFTISKKKKKKKKEKKKEILGQVKKKGGGGPVERGC